MNDDQRLYAVYERLRRGTQTYLGTDASPRATGEELVYYADVKGWQMRFTEEESGELTLRVWRGDRLVVFRHGQWVRVRPLGPTFEGDVDVSADGTRGPS
jgi:hypothetical protein